MGSEHYLNADFDLDLRSGWRPPDGETARRRITDLAWHALFLAGPSDSVLLPEPMPSDFTNYLDRMGIEIPTVTVEPGHGLGRRLSPFGWNRASADLAGRYDDTVNHPDLDVVRRVNGRRFSAELEKELFDQNHTTAVIENESALRNCLSTLPDSPNGWVLKTEHGNAGMGNRRMRVPILSDGDLKVVRRFFDEDEAIVLEPWRRRLSDLCATFVVRSNGKAEAFSLHELVNTADGALIGSLFCEDAKDLDEWRAAMAETVAGVSTRLAEEGYFGPVCIDAFVWDEQGRHILRRLVDLNARRAMSAGAKQLWRRLGGRGAAYWRFFSRRKLDLPKSFSELEQRLGDIAFDRERQRGVLITAPLWLGPQRRSPAKIAVLLLGRNRDEVLSMDRHLREVLEK